jgi:hypothetical protein
MAISGTKAAGTNAGRVQQAHSTKQTDKKGDSKTKKSSAEPKHAQAKREANTAKSNQRGEAQKARAETLNEPSVTRVGMPYESDSFIETLLNQMNIDTRGVTNKKEVYVPKSLDKINAQHPDGTMTFEEANPGLKQYTKAEQQWMASLLNIQPET